MTDASGPRRERAEKKPTGRLLCAVGEGRWTSHSKRKVFLL